METGFFLEALTLITVPSLYTVHCLPTSRAVEFQGWFIVYSYSGNTGTPPFTSGLAATSHSNEMEEMCHRK